MIVTKYTKSKLGGIKMGYIVAVNVSPRTG